MKELLNILDGFMTKTLRILYVILVIELLCIATLSAFGGFQQKPMLGEQIEWSKPISKGLVGFWPFNEGSGNKVFDLSGNGWTGTNQNSPIWTGGKFGSCLDYSGGTDYTQITGFTSNGMSQITVVIWFKSDGSQQAGLVSDNITSSQNDGINLFLWDSIIYWDVGKGASYGRASIDPWPDDTNWHQLVGVYDGVQVRAYLDTAIGGTAGAFTGTIGVTTHDLLFAQIQQLGGYEFNGKIGQVLIYNRALTVGEIAKLYAKPFCMFQQDVPLMAVEAPAPGRGQVIMITSLPVLFIGLYICRKYKEAA